MWTAKKGMPREEVVKAKLPRPEWLVSWEQRLAPWQGRKSKKHSTGWRRHEGCVPDFGLHPVGGKDLKWSKELSLESVGWGSHRLEPDSPSGK